MEDQAYRYDAKARLVALMQRGYSYRTAVALVGVHVSQLVNDLPCESVLPVIRGKLPPMVSSTPIRCLKTSWLSRIASPGLCQCGWSAASVFRANMHSFREHFKRLQPSSLAGYYGLVKCARAVGSSAFWIPQCS
jgi:hypothetical protein